MDRIKQYELKAACILSGQVPDDEIIAMMKDEDFARWYKLAVGLPEPEPRKPRFLDLSEW